MWLNAQCLMRFYALHLYLLSQVRLLLALHLYKNRNLVARELKSPLFLIYQKDHLARLALWLWHVRGRGWCDNCFHILHTKY